MLSEWKRTDVWGDEGDESNQSIEKADEYCLDFVILEILFTFSISVFLFKLLYQVIFLFGYLFEYLSACIIVSIFSSYMCVYLYFYLSKYPSTPLFKLPSLSLMCFVCLYNFSISLYVSLVLYLFIVLVLSVYLTCIASLIHLSIYVYLLAS